MSKKILDITKEKYFRLILERLLLGNSQGVYARDIMNDMKLSFNEVSAVFHYLDSFGAVKILYPKKDYAEEGIKPTYFMVFPNHDKILSEYNRKFTFRGWIKGAQDYSFLISIISIVIAIISLLISFFK